MSCWEVFFGTEKPCCVMMLKIPLSYNCKAHRITVKKSPTELCGVRTSVMLSAFYLIDKNYQRFTVNGMWYCAAMNKPTYIIDKLPKSVQYRQQKQVQHSKTSTLDRRGIDKYTLGDMLCY